MSTAPDRFKFRPAFEVCANCQHYEHYYQSSGWCRDEVHAQYFRNGMMVNDRNCCDRFEGVELDDEGNRV